MSRGIILLLAGLLLSYDRVSGVRVEHNDIRLVNLPEGELCEGRLEVYHSTEFVRGWFAVCDRSFGDEELKVVCRQLGCPHSSPSRSSVTRYGAWSGYMKALSKQCDGSERSFSSCADAGSYMCDFQDSDFVGIQCSKGLQLQESLTVTISCFILVILFFMF